MYYMVHVIMLPNLHNSILTLRINTASVMRPVPSKVNVTFTAPASTPRVFHSKSWFTRSSTETSSGHSVVKPGSRTAGARVNTAVVLLKFPTRSVNSDSSDTSFFNHRAHVV